MIKPHSKVSFFYDYFEILIYTLKQIEFSQDNPFAENESLHLGNLDFGFSLSVNIGKHSFILQQLTLVKYFLFSAMIWNCWKKELDL